MKISKESILKARQQIADNAQATIDEAVSGEVRVNDLEAWVKIQENHKAAVLAGEYDHTFPLLQKAFYIETGECPALLP